MTWTLFPGFALCSLACSLSATILAWKGRHSKAALWTAAAGIAILSAFIGGYWAGIDRPPLATMGETRLWYSFFLLLLGMLVYAYYRYRWILGMSTLLSGVFMLVNILRPEIHNQNLMPILKSVWFIPHVIVYIFAYGILGIAFLLSAYGLFRKGKALPENFLERIDTLTHMGAGFLLTGITLGALWAKQAWGYFWTWDPKETWALITLLCYAIYIGLRKGAAEIPPLRGKACLPVQIAGFLCLQVCWYGINYLNAARGLSVHIYG